MAQILVLGMHRSGTSTVTGLLHHMGAFIGTPEELIDANDENPKGFWERQDVIDENEALLARQHCRWHDLANWQRPASPEATVSMTAILEQLNQHPDWAIKDPRMCHTAPYWLAAIENPILILVHRQPLSIARSLQKRNRLPLEVGLALWEACAAELLQYRATYDCIELHYETLLANPGVQCARLREEIARRDSASQLRLPEGQRLGGFVDPALNRSASGESEKASGLSDDQQRLYKAIQGDIELPHPYVIGEGCKRLLRASNEIIELHNEKLTLEDEATRALKSIADLEKRLEETIQAENDLQHLQEEHTRLQTAFKSLEQDHANAQKYRLELQAIKASKWWRLRSSLLRETAN